MAKWVRLLPLTGVIFVGLLVVSIVISGNSPDDKASGASVIDFYRKNHDGQLASAFVGLYSGVFFLFFAATLRARLRERGRPDLAALSFGGAILFATSGAIFGALTFALANTADKLDASAAQTLGVLNNDLFFPSAIGGAVFLVASGLAAVLGAALPRWLGWVGIVIGVVSVTPLGMFGFFGLLAWVLVASLVMLLAGRGTSVATAGAGTSAPLPAGG